MHAGDPVGVFGDLVKHGAAALRTAGLPDAATVALAQLVAFLSYQTRVAAGLVAVDAPFLPKLSRSILLAWSERRITTRDAMPKWRRVLSAELAW
jgi:hypothetical protein